MSAPENPAAFPCSPGDVPFWNEGMTLRDWFAGQCLSSVFGSASNLGEISQEQRSALFEQVSSMMFEMADAMLAAREQKA